MKNKLFDITDKVIVVSGATGVLAGGVARYLADNGARVVFLGRNAQKLEEAGRFLEANGYDGLVCSCDVLDRTAVEVVRESVLKRWGRVDVLVNGAGGNMAGAVIQPDQSFFDLDVEAWNSVFSLNLRGTLIPTLVFGKCFESEKKGCIVNFSSMSAQQVITRILGYSNAKAAVDNLTKWLAVEFAKKIGEGVRVNAVAPGFFISEQNRTLLTNPDGSLTSRGHDIIKNTPFGRFGESEEVCGAVHYLCSDASKFVTGTVLAIDGGFSCFSGV